MDHYTYVLPELERRGLWGLFYVPTGMYGRRKLLDVHRIHCLLGRFGGQAMIDAVRELIADDMLSHAHVEEFREQTYSRQDNDTATTEFKDPELLRLLRVPRANARYAHGAILLRGRAPRRVLHPARSDRRVRGSP